VFDIGVGLSDAVEDSGIGASTTSASLTGPSAEEIGSIVSGGSGVSVDSVFTQCTTVYVPAWVAPLASVQDDEIVSGVQLSWDICSNILAFSAALHSLYATILLHGKLPSRGSFLMMSRHFQS
jgi:hypothetical protein